MKRALKFMITWLVLSGFGLYSFWGTKKIEIKPQGEFHKKNYGKIVFSKENLSVMNSQDITQVKVSSSFDLSDTIYLRAFLSDSIANLYSEKKLKAYRVKVCFEVRVNGQLIGSEGDFDNLCTAQIDDYENRDIEKESALPYGKVYGPNDPIYFKAPILGGQDTEKAPRGINGNFLFRGLQYLKENNTIQIKLRTLSLPDGNKEFLNDIAVGSFELKATPEKIKQFRLKHSEIPKSNLNNPSVLNQLKQLAAGPFSRDKVEIKHMVIWRDWTVQTNTYSGAIIKKFAYSRAVAKYPDKEFCKVVDLLYVQPYEGGGKYGPARFESVQQGDSSSYDIPCEIY